MNTISQTIAKVLLIGSLSLFVTGLHASGKHKPLKTKADTATELTIQGQIVVKNKEMKGNYTVEVMYYDVVTSAYAIKNNKPVNFILKKDAPYVLKISKKGFVPRYICLNTSTYGNINADGLYSFYFETDFIETKVAMKLDPEALELPIALIAYNPKSHDFIINRDYTRFVNQKLYEGVYGVPQLTAKN